MSTELSRSTEQQAMSKIDPMEMLFAELYGMYGNQFLDKFRSGHIEDGKDTGIEHTKVVWLEKIRSHGLRMPDIKRGLAGCERSVYAPNWADFLARCRPAPDLDAAINEALTQLKARNDGKDVWSNPAIYWAAQKVGYHEMMNLPHDKLRPRFSAAMDAVLSGPIDPVPTITPPPRIAMDPVTPEKVAECKQQTTQFVHRMTRGGVPTGLQWAQRIIDRSNAGDKSVTLYVLEQAQQALANGCTA